MGKIERWIKGFLEMILPGVADIPDLLRLVADLLERNLGAVGLAAVLMTAILWAWRGRDRGGGDDGGNRPGE